MFILDIVGIGVPILLGYVYGVVPISLCRSGGCGITTDGSGVRFEFEENETGLPSGIYPCKYTDIFTTTSEAPWFNKYNTLITKL